MHLNNNKILQECKFNKDTYFQMRRMKLQTRERIANDLLFKNIDMYRGNIRSDVCYKTL